MQAAKCFRAALAALIGFTAYLCAQAAPTSQFEIVQQGEGSLVLNLANVLNWDERGRTENTVHEVFVGAGARVVTLQWNLSLTAREGSYLSEMQLTFSDTLGSGVTFTPAGGADFDGSATYSGFQDLRPQGQDFSVGDDGMLRLEFHDAYKDLGFDEPEGVWQSGTLIFGVSAVPEPGSVALAMCGLIVIGALANRRSLVSMRSSVQAPTTPATRYAL